MHGEGPHSQIFFFLLFYICEEYKLSVFENKMLRKIFLTQKNEESEE